MRPIRYKSNSNHLENRRISKAIQLFYFYANEDKDRDRRIFADVLYFAVEQCNMSHPWHNFIYLAVVYLSLNSVFPSNFARHS